MKFPVTTVWFTLWTVCIAQDKPCEHPIIKHGERLRDTYRSNYPIGTYYYYRCHENFVTPSQHWYDTITCTQEGWWPALPCRRKCIFNYLENGHYSGREQSRLQGESIRVECYYGYSLENEQNTMTCTETGWVPPPKCIQVKKECMFPKIDSNLIVQPSKDKYKIGDVVKMSCRQKLFRVGPDSVQCYQFGWSPNFPTCKGQVKSCCRPPLLLNGHLKEERGEEYDHTDVVEYVCNPRYLMKGSNKIQCIDGEWTALPKCIEEKRTCGEVPALANGFVVSGVPPYHHGNSVQFSCGQEFTLIGHRSVTCSHGTWSQLPECIETNILKKCKRTKLLTTEPFLVEIPEFDHGNNVTYKCKEKGESKYSTCINGNWNPEINCKETSKQVCPPPPQIPHAEAMTTTVNYQEGEKIPLLCEENYLMEEGEEIVCKDGRWQSIPQCVDPKEKCGPPPVINNGDIISPISQIYAPESSVEYKCKSYYTLQGERNVLCSNGQWSKPPECLEPCIITRAAMDEHNILLRWVDMKKLYLKSGDTAEFACKIGYKQQKHELFQALCDNGKLIYPTCIKENDESAAKF